MVKLSMSDPVTVGTVEIRVLFQYQDILSFAIGHRSSLLMQLARLGGSLPQL